MPMSVLFYFGSYFCILWSSPSLTSTIFGHFGHYGHGHFLVKHNNSVRRACFRGKWSDQSCRLCPGFAPHHPWSPGAPVWSYASPQHQPRVRCYPARLLEDPPDCLNTPVSSACMGQTHYHRLNIVLLTTHHWQEVFRYPTYKVLSPVLVQCPPACDTSRWHHSS